MKPKANGRNAQYGVAYLSADNNICWISGISTLEGTCYKQQLSIILLA
jgi:hypothetical protein